MGTRDESLSSRSGWLVMCLGGADDAHALVSVDVSAVGQRLHQVRCPEAPGDDRLVCGPVREDDLCEDLAGLG